MPDSPAFKPSAEFPEFRYENFDEYVEFTRNWLKENRAFISEDAEAELNANAPYEIKPLKQGEKRKGILLVHGLGDSPYSFVDVAPALAEQGFLVRVVLLQGHGSKPADLIPENRDAWQEMVEFHTRQLRGEVDELWLGGFSTGANLVTSLALQQPDIKGLLLFSPGFKPKSSMVSLAPYLSKVKDWADIDETDNYVRYDSLAVNGAGEYYKTSAKVREDLKAEPFNRPAFIVMSEYDSVIDPKGVLELFESRFTHPDSQFFWYGNDPESQDTRVSVYQGRIPELRISNFSHMAPLFAPENPYYGQNGSYRMCNNGQLGKAAKECPVAEEVWYSAWGYREKDKTHARLTWNPYFDEQMSVIHQILHKKR
ncbi:alpha/beta hydrolase [Endozoicomonas arenosclerae]|uniref:alpha/beta hydrolase n=1 Tax=Endozoicomonas arenosclerae TaxID=1633495 RepID=UPI00155FEDC5|nr:alpha/beta fold hydrolase [Endozoicomonas arenosclerae]